MNHLPFTKRVALIMGMPITVEISKSANIDSYADNQITELESKKAERDIEKVFEYFRSIDGKYSPFKETSEVGKLNRGEEVSDEMQEILRQAQDFKDSTSGYFDIKRPDGKIDPSGIVKGWAINNAAKILKDLGYKRFYIDAGGDAEIVGRNWSWGIRNPFNVGQNVKILKLSNCGIATSGTYERGQHIYDPVGGKSEITNIVSMTVIGPNVFEADKFSTPAFAMGKRGIEFIESKKGLEGYMIDRNGIATMTTGFSKYTDI